MTECVFILISCNINAISALIIMNNIRKELVMIAAHYGDQIAANQSTKSIKIKNIDSNRQQIRAQNQSQLVILIITIWKIFLLIIRIISLISLTETKGRPHVELLDSWRSAIINNKLGSFFFFFFSLFFHLFFFSKIKFWKIFEESFVPHFFYFQLTKNFFYFFLFFFENKFIHPDEIGCWQLPLFT